MTVCSKSERVTTLDMFERETRRERILENRSKALRVAEKQAAIRWTNKIKKGFEYYSQLYQNYDSLEAT